MTIKRFKQTQKFRIIVGDTVHAACFYATARQIRNGVGDFVKCNAATQKALDALEFQRSGDDILACSTGLAGTWEGVPVQLNVA
jgi:hypothetical protein